MKRTQFRDAPCPIARTTDLMGDWWTPLVIREAARGVTRFEQFQERLGCSRATLTDRLRSLVEDGLLTKRAYQQRPVRYEYELTEKGRAFFGVLAAMWRFGEDWMFDRTPPVELYDRRTKEPVRAIVVDERTGEPISVEHVAMGRRRSRPQKSQPDDPSDHEPRGHEPQARTVPDRTGRLLDRPVVCEKTRGQSD